MRNILPMLFFLLSGTVQAADLPPAMGAAQHAHHAGMKHSWTDLPLLKTKAGGERRERVTVVPQNIVADAVDAYSNKFADESGRRRLPLELAGARLDKLASGGFHWLAAREERGDAVRVASTVYYYGERGAANPTDMFMTQKHELEILPQPYPREHSRYRANEDWKFLMRFNGRPLAKQTVVLETSNGSRRELASDAQGIVVASIPDDFKAEAEGKEGGHGHGRPGADFVLAAEYADGGKTYLTAFNAGYGPDAYNQRSIAMGLGFTLLGMIGAAPLLLRRKKSDASAQKKEAGNA